MNKSYYYIFFIGIFSILIGIFRYISDKNNSLSKVISLSINKPLITSKKNSNIKKRIIFAGISGASPRYIDHGPLKGMGWMEFEISEIKKGLINDGFDIIDEYMSPARIAYEFKGGNPICVWPTEFKNPEKIFSTRPDQIYSIPLKISGDESHKIMFHKDEIEKFKKHMQDNGNINIDSLLRDRSLKTILIQDFDYGDLGKKILELNQKGEMKVKKGFQQSVTLWSIKDNLQLLEMLNAHHVDYILSNSIEENHFINAKLSKDKFINITFETKRLSGPMDPNLIFSSISCAINPLTIKVLPYINKWINTLRGVNWTISKIGYQKKLIPSLSINYSFTTMFTFKGLFEHGGLDFWYPWQQKFFSNLRLFPKPPKALKVNPISQISHPLRWRILSESLDAITIVNQTSNLESTPFFFIGDEAKNNPYYDILLGNYLSFPQLSLNSNFDLHFTHPLAATEFENLPFDQYKNIKKITLFAQGLTKEKIKKVIPYLKDLNNLTIFGASPEVSSIIIDALPLTLEHLNLTSSSLGNTNIQIKIKKMPLKSLHLSDTQLTEDQLRILIPNIPISIEDLSLGYLRTALDFSVTKIFNSLFFPHLKYLDVENNWLTDEDLKSISHSIPLQIKTLRLGLNSLGPNGLHDFFKKEFTHLEYLDLSENRVGSILPLLINLPKMIKNLKIQGSGLNEKNIHNISFPNKLENLNISMNYLGDAGAKVILQNLDNKVKNLILTSTGITVNTIKELIKKDRFVSIVNLHLNNNNLTDADIQTLSLGTFTLRKLNLKGNHIGNIGAKTIAQKWLPKLTELQLSNNPISDLGIAALSKKFPDQLEVLELKSILSLNSKLLPKQLPTKLKSLDISENHLTDNDLILISKSLPKGLKELNLSYSYFGERGAWHLAKNLPQNLKILNIERTPLSNEAILHLSKAFPSSIKELEIGPIEMDSSTLKSFSMNLPKALSKLILIVVKAPSGDLSPVMRVLPKSLMWLEMRGVPLSLDTSKVLNNNWPPNLRQFYLLGYEMGEEKLNAVFKDMPKTLEVLSLLGVGLGDSNIKQLYKHSFHHLFFIQLARSNISGIQLNKFLQRNWNLNILLLSGNPQFNDETFSHLKKENLRRIRRLFLENSSLTNDGLKNLFAILPPQTQVMSLISNKISSVDLDKLLESIPRDLNYLVIKGNEIGEKEKELFQEYAKKKNFMWNKNLIIIQ